MNPSSPAAAGASFSIKPDGSVFELVGFEFEAGVFTASYRGVVDETTQHFEERIEFPIGDSEMQPSGVLLRLLAMAASLSYFKATRAEKISVAFPASSSELRFFRELIANGLGEYAYVNDLPWKLTPEIEANLGEPQVERGAIRAGKRPLVAVGGGKDSIVTIEALKASGFEPVLYSVNDRGAIGASVAASRLPYFTVRRVIDPALLRANARGALNGHVPVTAINSLIGLIAAELKNLGPVIFSNEESANYGNLSWLGRDINHQWSKGLEYEDLLRDTLGASKLDPDSFFSLLRGYRELEIARAFAASPEYFGSFTSCNRAYRAAAGEHSMVWCGECAKCAFVFLLLADFLPRQVVVEIFGKDMLAAPDTREIMAQVLGLGQQKPFDCVGEPSEAQQALRAAAAKWPDSELVAELVGLLDATSSADPAPQLGEDRVPEPYRAARDRVGATL